MLMITFLLTILAGFQSTENTAFSSTQKTAYKLDSLPQNTLTNKPQNDCGKLTLKKKVNKALGVSRINGISLGMHSTDFNFDYKNMLIEISQLNTEWVCINTFFYQTYIDSDSIQIPSPNSPYWQQLKRTLKQAKAQGLKVMLMPIVLLQKPKTGEWRGKIIPKSKAKWFDSYQKLLLQLGTLATQTQTDLLAIGSEYTSLQKNDTWLTLIRSLKTVYQGSLTYSCNWDAIGNIAFLKELDLLGLNGYFPLSDQKEPSFQVLKATWIDLKKELLALQTEHNIPLFFSEVGYASIDGINTAPWNYFISEKIDLKEQAACFQAFYETWIDENNFYGVFFYEWFGQGGRCDSGYTFKDKPALEVVKKWMIDSHSSIKK